MSLRTIHPAFPRTGLCIALSLALGATSACRSHTLRPTQLSEEAVTLDLPLVEQDELYGCGLASLAALCEYWDVAIPTEQSSALAALAEEHKGLSGGELRDALEQLGLETYLFHGALDRSTTGLYRHVDAGRPPLVMLAASNGNHYSLVLGYDEPRDNVILLDPLQGQVLIPKYFFERSWERCQRFTLLACPPERLDADPIANPDTENRS